jgi:hypothetical protein
MFRMFHWWERCLSKLNVSRLQNGIRLGSYDIFACYFAVYGSGLEIRAVLNLIGENRMAGFRVLTIDQYSMINDGSVRPHFELFWPR